MSAELAAGVALAGAGAGAGAASADLLLDDSDAEASVGFLASSSTWQSASVQQELTSRLVEATGNGHAALQQRITGAT